MITIRITGLRELEQKFSSLPLLVKGELKAAVKISLRDIRDRARQAHKFQTRSGETERGIEFETLGELSGRVGVTTEVGVWLHEGTGIYGPKGRPIIITPKTRTALRWPTGTGFNFAKRVVNPGIEGDPFLYRAARNETAAIRGRFEAAIRGIIK